MISSKEIEKAVNKEFPRTLIEVGEPAFHTINIGDEKRIIVQIWDGRKLVNLSLTDKQAMYFADTFSKMVRGTRV